MSSPSRRAFLLSAAAVPIAASLPSVAQGFHCGGIVQVTSPVLVFESAPCVAFARPMRPADLDRHWRLLQFGFKKIMEAGDHVAVPTELHL